VVAAGGAEEVGEEEEEEEEEEAASSSDEDDNEGLSGIVRLAVCWKRHGTRALSLSRFFNDTLESCFK
jgi:hypothetical protein